MGEIRLRDVGPIEALTFTLPDEGGVFVARGYNGSGKSHALAGVQTLLDGEGKVPVRDGCDRAEVEGFGARLRVGRKSQRSGELDVEFADGADPSLLVDPSIKDPAAADASRIKAVLRITKTSGGPALFADLVGSTAELLTLVPSPVWDETDLPAMVAGVKRALEGHARKHEQSAEAALVAIRGAQNTLETLTKDVDLTGAPSLEAAQAAHETAVREEAEARGKHNAAVAAQAAGRQAATALESLGDAGTEEQLEAANADMLAVREEVTALERQLEHARYKLQLAESNVDKQRKAAEQRAPLAELIAAGEAAEDIPLGVRGALAARVTDTRNDVERATLAERTATLRADLERLRKEEAIAYREGNRLREAAQGTEFVLSSAVANLGTPLRISAGRLLAEHPQRGWIAFAELSAGERWRVALDLTVATLGAGGCVVVRQEAWESLDPLRRAEVATLARERRIAILTAEASLGELRVEEYVPAEAEAA